MYTIYCVEDINDLKYVGSTKQSLSERLYGHISDKRIGRYCSSKKLDLDNCKIYSLETGVSEKNKKEKEGYWINKIDCVNIYKLDYDDCRYKKKYYERCKLNDKQKVKDYWNERHLFRSKKVVNGCYEFIKMLEEY